MLYLSLHVFVGGHGMRLESMLDMVGFALAEYGFAAVRGSPVNAFFVGLWFSGDGKFDMGKYIIFGEG